MRMKKFKIKLAKGGDDDDDGDDDYDDDDGDDDDDDDDNDDDDDDGGGCCLITCGIALGLTSNLRPEIQGLCTWREGFAVQTRLKKYQLQQSILFYGAKV